MRGLLGTIITLFLLFLGTSFVFATNNATYCESQEILAVNDCAFLSDLIFDNDLESTFGNGMEEWCASEFISCDEGSVVGLTLIDLNLNSFPFDAIEELGNLTKLHIAGSSDLFDGGGLFGGNVNFDSDSITELLLENNNITAINWVDDLDLPNLSLLSLKNNAIEDFSTKSLQTFPLLTSLDVSNNILSDLDFLRNIPDTIQYLDVSYNQLISLGDFASLDFLSLQSLELSYNQLVDVTALGETSLPALHYLFLNHNNIKDFSPVFAGDRNYYFVRLHNNDYNGYFPITLDNDFSYEVGRIGLQIFYGNSICGRFPQEFVNVLDLYPLLVFFHDYSPKALSDIDFLACDNDSLCLVNEDCQSDYCTAGVCRPKEDSGGTASESGTGDKDWLIIAPEQADQLIIKHDQTLENTDEVVESTQDTEENPAVTPNGGGDSDNTATGAVSNTDNNDQEDTVEDVTSSATVTTNTRQNSNGGEEIFIEEFILSDDVSEAIRETTQEDTEEAGFTVPEGTIGSLYWTPNYLYAHGVLKPLSLKTFVVLLGEWSQNGLPIQGGVLAPLYSTRYNPECIGFGSLEDDLETKYIQGAYKCLGGGRKFSHYYSYFTIKDFVKQFSLLLSS